MIVIRLSVVGLLLFLLPQPRRNSEETVSGVLRRAGASTHPLLAAVLRTNTPTLRRAVGSLRTLATLTQTPTARPVLLEDVPEAQRSSLPTFTISQERGFLPRTDPLAVLPQQFAPVESLLQRMTIKQADGSKGLLALGQFGDAVNVELKDLAMISKVRDVIASGDQVRQRPRFRVRKQP